MTETKITGGNGVGFIGLLTIAFIVLKLVGVINWSWWWVLSPILIFWGLILILFLIIFFSLLIKEWSKYD
jgi:hypothetical protein